ncbi:MAG: cytochrome P450 [Myxococcota bacterium]
MPEPDALEMLDLVGPDTYVAHGYPHAAWARLRRERPVFWCAPGGDCTPFWAITRHADIIAVSKRPRVLLNAPRLAVFPEGLPPEEQEVRARHLLNMDPPDHARYRKLVSSWFTPRSIGRLAPEVERITREILDGLTREGATSELDFVSDVAAPLTLWVLAEMLGVPREDWRRMFEWTNQIAGSSDPEFRKPGATAQETAAEARQSLFEYFAALAEERRASPRNDIVSVLANAKLDGEPLHPLELLSFYFLLVVAGNETTRNAASGGLLALIENPDELEKLRLDPGGVERAVEEIVRWTSPVIQFCRTPTHDLELGGQKIRAGQALCLFYPSANRDEAVFDAPDSFRVDRAPNPHLGFGIGEHFCLGANLARLELRVLLRELVARIESVELSGPFERTRSSFLGGVKRMPLRWMLRAPSPGRA